MNIIVSVVLSKKNVYICVLFRTVSEIDLFHCTVPKLLIRKRCYALFLIYSVVLVRKLTIPTERPPHVGEVSAKFCG
jgi:hypothetical protein